MGESRVTDRMKRCARCDREYEANYDACPHCARDATAQAEKKKGNLPLMVCGGMFVAGLVLYAMGAPSLGGLLMGLAIPIWIVWGLFGFFQGVGKGYKQG
jgi:hypothetical protein